MISDQTSETPEMAEENLRAKAAEFERTLDHLTQKMQEGAEFVRKFREDTSQFAETVQRPGTVLQPYLEKGMQLAEEYIHTYVNEAAHSLEESTERVLEKISGSLKTGIEKMEARPLIPGVALFLGGFIFGTLMTRPNRIRRRAPSESTATPGLRRIEGGISTSSSPSG